MNRHLLRPVSLALICNLPFSAFASINSAAIVASSLSPQCLEYKVVGICYWLLLAAVYGVRLQGEDFHQGAPLRTGCGGVGVFQYRGESVDRAVGAR